MIPRLLGIGLLWLMTSLVTVSSHAQSASISEAEQQVRAQFVYNFANFVEWPDDAFADAKAPIKVCLFGEVDFAPYLYSFAGTLIGERPLVVQKADEIEQIRAGCHVLYVGQDERVRLPTFWQEIQYIYVLSIGDRHGFAGARGLGAEQHCNPRILRDRKIASVVGAEIPRGVMLVSVTKPTDSVGPQQRLQAAQHRPHIPTRVLAEDIGRTGGSRA